jgi:TPR repeat protein
VGGAKRKLKARLNQLALKFLSSRGLLGRVEGAPVHMIGLGVWQDKKKAVRCFQLVAKQGHANARFSLGVCFSMARACQFSRF